MTVYCVFEHDWEGSFLHFIASTEAKGLEWIEKHIKEVYRDRYTVDEWKIDSEDQR